MLTTTPQILLAGLLIGLSAGFVMHRSSFCLTAVFRDLVLFRDPFMLRTLALLVVASMILFEGARRLGIIPFYPFPLLGRPSISQAVGGAAFGAGMVLSGGCVVGTLYRMGAGQTTSLCAFVGLVLGSGLYAAIHPAWAGLARALALPGTAATLPALLGVDPGTLVLLVALPSAAVFLRWRAGGKWARNARAEGYLQPWAAALILAFLGLSSYVLVGMPIGVTTSYAKMAAWTDRALFGGHLAGTSFFRTVPLDTVNPLTGAVLRGGPGPVFDAIAAIQIPVIAGIALGGTLSAASLGEIGFLRPAPTRQLLAAFAGGAVMGIASRLAPGCNVWHLMGGLPVFAVPSLLFLAGLIPGTWLGARAMVRILS